MSQNRTLKFSNPPLPKLLESLIIWTGEVQLPFERGQFLNVRGLTKRHGGDLNVQTEEDYQK